MIEAILFLAVSRRLTETNHGMAAKRFLLNPSRSAKQGVGINVGKFGAEYEKIVTTLTICKVDMEALGVQDGDSVVVRTEIGEAVFQCEVGNVPEGMLFVPYGPPTCRLMGGDTGGTGMPLSKGWDVEVEPVGK
jgi:formylmethanofuran dehydrogenase subunit D